MIVHTSDADIITWLECDAVLHEQVYNMTQRLKKIAHSRFVKHCPRSLSMNVILRAQVYIIFLWDKVSKTCSQLCYVMLRKTHSM